MEKQMNVKLNCDMGEGFDLDELIMPHINMTNLACGYHAANALSMYESVKLAVNNDVEIGAHPSYEDRENFGRVSMKCTSEEIKTLVLYQLGALDAICKAQNSHVVYVKPHGALYNDMMKDDAIFTAITQAISSYNQKIKLMILSTTNNEKFQKIALPYGICLLYEVFADRNYNDDGTLVSRSKDNAVIEDEKSVVSIAKMLRDEGYIKSINGIKLYLDVNSICVHGDNHHALTLIKSLRGVFP